MVEHISEDELKRIQAFAETPAYDRDPEQLMPQESRRQN